MSHSKNNKPTRWLITGGCGFIGTSLIKNLVAEGGHFIRVLDNLSVGTRDDLARVCKFSEKQGVKSKKNSSLLTSHSLLIELVVGDIRDSSTCLSCSKDIDIIVHLAASTGVGPSVKNPRQDMEANVIGTFNMLEAARQNNIKRFIFASSGAPIGECEPPIHEELAPHPVSPYGASKLACEGYCSAYFRTFGIATVSLRFGNVYGPGSTHKNSVIARFIKQAMDGETLEIYGDGKQTRDFIYIDDLVDAIVKAVTFECAQPINNEIARNDSLLTPHSSLKAPWGETFQIATSTETNIIEIVDMLILILADKGFKDIKVEHSAPQPGEVRRNYSDTLKAYKILRWKSDIDLKEGLKRTIEWFIKKHA